MNNPTNIDIPKKYQSMISEVYKDSDGYWAYSVESFYFKAMGCHIAHKDSQAELLQVIKTLRSCSCADCRNWRIKQRAKIDLEEEEDDY